MEPNSTQPSSQTNPHHRGTRHLRVGVEVRDRSAGITSMWLVDQPVVQSSRLVGPLLARVDLAGSPVLVEGFDDPRITRSTYRKDVGHLYARVDAGIVYVSVPFTDVRQLAEVRIRLLDASRVQGVPSDPVKVAELFNSPPDSIITVVDLGTDDLRKHRDFAQIAASMGIATERPRFEIYRDRAQLFRWQLRRANGEIVAASGGGYADRETCEEEIRWIRAQAAEASVVAHDLSGNPCLS